MELKLQDEKNYKYHFWLKTEKSDFPKIIHAHAHIY